MLAGGSGSGAERFVTAGSIHFLLGLVRDEFRVHRVGSRYTIPPTFVPGKIDTSGEDWAIVHTDELYCGPVLRHSAGLIQAANFRSAVVF
jgi:hypothetical protein